MKYDDFVKHKLSHTVAGTDILSPTFPVCAFPHQRALSAWSLKRGRSAIFADTGLGKTLMELIWAQNVHVHTDGDILIMAPLAVGAQIVAEARVLLGIAVHVCKSQSDVRRGINVTNYDRLHLFDPEHFAGVVLDESGVIKHSDSKTFMSLTKAFARTQYKLAATATPAPNDWTELGTHAEFLGVCTQDEMFAEFFTHDNGVVDSASDWRLKRHAAEQFWKWVASWGALITKPSDLGYDDTGYVLPQLHIKRHKVETPSRVTEGFFFEQRANTMQERRVARRSSIDQRIAACAVEAQQHKQDPYLVWCDLNAESTGLMAAIPNSVQITGADSPEDKERRLMAFARGEIRVLITKPSIAGWGLNWQHCNRMGFVGVTDSYEALYQAIRRCWRFGQKREVFVDLFASTGEGAVMANLQRKEESAKAMAAALKRYTRASVLGDVESLARESNAYKASTPMARPKF